MDVELYEIYTGASSNPPRPHMAIHILIVFFFFNFKNQYGMYESRAHHILIMTTPYNVGAVCISYIVTKLTAATAYKCSCSKLLRIRRDFLGYALIEKERTKKRVV